MLPITDDPELTKMAAEANAALEKEIDENPEMFSSHDEIDLDKEFSTSESDTMTAIDEFAKEEIEIKPCETLAEFRDALALAELNGIKSIQASKKVIFHYTKPDYPKHGYYFHSGVRVDEIGKTAEIEKLLSKSIEEVNFGKR